MTPRIVELGSGRPIVLVPGIQGRFEWGLPTARALASLGHVVTYSLADEPTSGFAWNADAGFENYVRQLAQVIATQGLEHPVLVGVSYGGLVATEYAARHRGEVDALVVASAPPPSWTLPARALRYLAAPTLMAPVFWAGAPMRVMPGDRWRFILDHGLRIARSPASSARMARRLRWLTAARCSTSSPLDVPALIVTGEDALERVVPPEATRQFQRWLPDARVVTLAHTGHNGTVMRAREFSAAVGEFLAALPAHVERPGQQPPSSEIVRAHRVS
jgi:pimeloyl-ACP methyl ester carboxylesterase